MTIKSWLNQKKRADEAEKQLTVLRAQLDLVRNQRDEANKLSQELKVSNELMRGKLEGYESAKTALEQLKKLVRDQTEADLLAEYIKGLFGKGSQANQDILNVRMAELQRQGSCLAAQQGPYSPTQAYYGAQSTARINPYLIGQSY